MITVSFNSSYQARPLLAGACFLQPFTCELTYAPGKTRPEVFLLDRNTQLGQTLVRSGCFIRVIERLDDNLEAAPASGV